MSRGTCDSSGGSGVPSRQYRHKFGHGTPRDRMSLFVNISREVTELITQMKHRIYISFSFVTTPVGRRLGGGMGAVRVEACWCSTGHCPGDAFGTVILV